MARIGSKSQTPAAQKCDVCDLPRVEGAVAPYCVKHLADFNEKIAAKKNEKAPAPAPAAVQPTKSEAPLTLAPPAQEAPKASPVLPPRTLAMDKAALAAAVESLGGTALLETRPGSAGSTVVGNLTLPSAPTPAPAEAKPARKTVPQHHQLGTRLVENSKKILDWAPMTEKLVPGAQAKIAEACRLLGEVGSGIMALPVNLAGVSTLGMDMAPGTKCRIREANLGSYDYLKVSEVTGLTAVEMRGTKVMVKTEGGTVLFISKHHLARE